MSERTRTEIYEEATELAEEVFGMDPDTTTDEAMATVWEELPELYDEYTAAPAGLPPQPIAKSEPEVTVGEHIHQAVRKQASQLAWTQWPHKSLEELEWEVWNTDDGKLLYELYRSEGQTPMSHMRSNISKSDRHRDAYLVLHQWAG